MDVYLTLNALDEIVQEIFQFGKISEARQIQLISIIQALVKVVNRLDDDVKGLYGGE